MAGILSQQFRDAVSKHKDYRMKDESTASVAFSTGFLNFISKRNILSIHHKFPEFSTLKICLLLNFNIYVENF